MPSSSILATEWGMTAWTRIWINVCVIDNVSSHVLGVLVGLWTQRTLKSPVCQFDGSCITFGHENTHGNILVCFINFRIFRFGSYLHRRRVLSHCGCITEALLSLRQISGKRKPSRRWAHVQREPRGSYHWLRLHRRWARRCNHWWWEHVAQWRELRFQSPGWDLSMMRGGDRR